MKPNEERLIGRGNELDEVANILRLSPLDELVRVLIKYLPVKGSFFDRIQKLQGYSRHVPTFYALLTPVLQLTTGSSNFHGGYFRNAQESWPQAQTNLTRLLGETCGFRPEHHLLDVGCGIGGPAITMAQTYGSRITGLNITRSQLTRARKLVRYSDLEPRILFTRGDALKMPFRWACFDHAYAIESLSHMPDKDRVVSEVARVTYPGARFGILDGCVQDHEALVADPDFNLFNIGWGVRGDEWTRPHEIPEAFQRHGFRLAEARDLGAEVGPSALAQAEFARKRKKLICDLYGEAVFDIIIRTMEISARLVASGVMTYTLWIGEKVS